MLWLRYRVAHHTDGTAHPDQRAIAALDALVQRERWRFPGQQRCHVLRLKAAADARVYDLGAVHQQQRFACVTGDLAQLRIDLQNIAAQLDLHDADGRLHHRGTVMLFHLFAFGNIFHHANEIAGASLLVARQRHSEPYPDGAAIFVQVTFFARYAFSLASEQCFFAGRQQVTIFMVCERPRRQSQQLVFFITQHAAKAAIHMQKSTINIGMRETYGRLLEGG